MNKDKKIRLLIITPSLQCGGSEKFVMLLCNHINTNRFAVRLLVIDNSHPFYSINQAAVQLVDLKKSRVLFSLGAIKSQVKDFKPDIIFSTANHLNLYLAIFRRRFDNGIKFIAREASIVSINSRQAKLPMLYNWLIKKYYHRFNQVICQSVYMQSDLLENYNISPAQTVVIHNATEETGQLPILTPSTSDHKIYKFISVGRLSTEKGMERLIHAVGLLSIPFQFYITGAGKQRPHLEKLVADLQLQQQVFFTGEKIRPFSGMEDADLLLMGSYYEGFPNVALEAAAHGIPVVAFDVPGGIAEIVVDGENGFLVTDNDLIGFAATVQRALSFSFNRQQIAANNNTRFSIHRMITAVEKLFLNLTADK